MLGTQLSAPYTDVERSNNHHHQTTRLAWCKSAALQ